jgi:hypothetical protein
MAGVLVCLVISLTLFVGLGMGFEARERRTAWSRPGKGGES